MRRSAARRAGRAVGAALLVLGVIVQSGSCGGSRQVSAPSATSPQMTLTITVAVTNTKFGTALPGDFAVSITGPTPPVAVSAADEGVLVAGLSLGVSYLATASGPAGYDLNRSGDCSGASIAGQRNCRLTFVETPMTCDDALWSPVYLRDRLNVLSGCEAASGVVADVGLEPDGDLVMELIPDPPYVGLLRPGNFTNPDAHNHLVVEVPCQGPTDEAAPKAACVQFAGAKVPMPIRGAHIVAAAHWVEDRNHSRWGELHGARIIALPR